MDLDDFPFDKFNEYRGQELITKAVRFSISNGVTDLNGVLNTYMKLDMINCSYIEVNDTNYKNGALNVRIYMEYGDSLDGGIMTVADMNDGLMVVKVGYLWSLIYRIVKHLLIGLLSGWAAYMLMHYLDS